LLKALSEDGRGVGHVGSIRQGGGAMRRSSPGKAPNTRSMMVALVRAFPGRGTNLLPSWRLVLEVFPLHGAAEGLDAEDDLAVLEDPHGAARFADGDGD